LTNDQPIHIMMQVNKAIKICDLIQRVISVKDVNIDKEFYNK